MYKIVKKDMFNISRRIKHIDKSYYIVFNNKLNRWEVHSTSQVDRFCLVSPYKSLDTRLLDYVYRTSLVHNPHLLKDIEEYNEKIDIDVNNKRSDYITSNLSDVYQVLSGSSKSYNWKEMIKTKWL